MVEGEGLGLVKRNEDFGEEDLVLFFEWDGKSVDDTPQDFKQFSNAIVHLQLIDEVEEDVIDGPANKGPQVEEFTVNSMEGSL